MSELTQALKVQEKITETKDSCSIVFEIPKDKKMDFNYRPGQFITLFMDINGEKVSRSYSLSSCPMTDSEFKITVKKIPNGKGSTYLVDQVNTGDSLQSTKPAGNFYKPVFGDARHYVLFAAGSGVTPIMSILKSVLYSNDKNQVTFIYANRDADNIIFKNQLDELQKQHSERMNVIHNLSSITGRLDSPTASIHIKKCLAGAPCEYYMCGPDGFMDSICEALNQLGVNKETIHRESFGTSTNAESSLDGYVIGDAFDGGPTPHKVIAEIDGETVEVEDDGASSILELLMSAGHNPPFSCMSGSCMACMAVVEKGSVHQDELGILEDDDIAERKTLTCQCRPLTSEVKVIFDD